MLLLTILPSMKCRFLLACIVGVVIGATSCSKSTETLDVPTLANMANVALGKVWFYRLDSTVVPSFGSTFVIKRYQCRDSVVSSGIDAQGNVAYTLHRHIRDTLGTQAWQYRTTIQVVFRDNNVEYIEDNLRFIKLHKVITEGFSWKGNSYIDTRSINSSYKYLDGWDYTYVNVLAPYTTRKGVIDSTVTVMQRDETSPPGPFDPNNFQQKDYSMEVYGKNVGLIYKEFLHYTWQTSPAPGYESGTYGIKLNLINYK